MAKRKQLMEIETVDGERSIVKVPYFTIGLSAEYIVSHGVWLSDTEWCPPTQVRRLRIKEAEE